MVRCKGVRLLAGPNSAADGSGRPTGDPSRSPAPYLNAPNRSLPSSAQNHSRGNEQCRPLPLRSRSSTGNTGTSTRSSRLSARRRSARRGFHLWIGTRTRRVTRTQPSWSATMAVSSASPYTARCSRSHPSTATPSATSAVAHTAPFVQDAMDHPYFQGFHDPTKYPVCPAPSFEEQMSIEEIKNLIYNEALALNPEFRA